MEEKLSTHQSLSRESRALDRLGSSVSPVGQPRRKNLGEDGRWLTKEGSTKSSLGIEFFMEGNSIHHGETLELQALCGREK
jgi:hypothetical protein